MLIARAHACSSCSSLSSCSSQRVGALSLIPFCLGISGHPSGSGKDTHGSGKAVGGPNTVQHSSKEQKQANMVVEQCRSKARMLAARALLTRVCCVMTGQRNEEPTELMHEDFQVHVDSDWVGDLLCRKNTTGVIVRRGIEERVSMTSENKITFETNCETNEYLHLFINTEMLVIAARTRVDYVECTSMVFHSSAKSCKNVGTREMGSRVQCNEFGDETNQRLVEPGMSAKRVGTSVRLVGDDFCVVARQKQMQTWCELSMWEILVCERDDRLEIKQFPCSPRQERSVAQESILRFR